MKETERSLTPGTAVERSPEEIKRILRERAKALAKPLEEPAPRGEVLELLVFSLAGERYAIEAASVLEVMPLRDLTAVPCTPPTILGVVNHRGRILPVLDFRRLLDLPGQAVGEKRWIVVVDTDGMTFGIGAEAVTGTIPVAASDLASPPRSLAGDRQAFIRGVTGEMVAVLDLTTLAGDPRIVVNEEVI